jgi:hypothetical protein
MNIYVFCVVRPYSLVEHYNTIINTHDQLIALVPVNKFIPLHTPRYSSNGYAILKSVAVDKGAFVKLHGKKGYVRFEVSMAVTMKNAVFWDIKTQFVPHRRHTTSLLQRPAGSCHIRCEVFTTVTMTNAVF